MKRSDPKVAIMIINYNGKRWLDRCLNSLVKTAYPKFSIYLIDNASTDGSTEYVQTNFPQVRIVKHDENVGFAKGYNLAIKKIKADYIAALNNDTETLKIDWLDSMVGLAEEDPKIAAISCKMVFMSDRSIIDSVGSVGIPYWRGFEDIGFGEKDEGKYDDPPIEPFSFCGGACLIRWKSFLEVGGFDESFFAFMEDIDLSWRLRLRGYSIKYMPEAKIAHYYSGTYSEGSEKTYLCKRNLLRSILKNCEGGTLRWALRNYLLFTLLASLSYLKVENAPLMVWALMKSVLWNLWHLPDTLSQRRKIQDRRIVEDHGILSLMYPDGLMKKGRGSSFEARLGDRIFGRLPNKMPNN